MIVFTILRFPLAEIPRLISTVIDARVSAKRIDAFLSTKVCARP